MLGDMKISEVIARLQEIRDNYGDVPCVVNDGSGTPASVTSIAPRYRNEQSRRFTDGTGKRCRRVAQILG